MEINFHNPTICFICGGDAQHYNYGLPSCNSCKTFFRRCIVRAKNYKCKYGGECIISKKNQCKGCRLKLCLKLGMDPTKINPTGRVRKPLSGKNRIPMSYFSTRNISISLVDANCTVYTEIKNLLYIESKMQRLRESVFSPEKLIRLTIKDVLMRPSELRNAEKYEKPHNWPLNTDDFIENIGKRLKMAVMLGQKVQTLRRFSLALDNLIIIEAAKTLPCFVRIPLEDQIKILKHITIVNTTLTECFYSIENKQTTIVMPDGTILIKNRTIQNKLSRYPVNQHLIEEVFSKVLEPFARVAITRIEYVLLKTIIYCYHGVRGISEYTRQMFQDEEVRYSNLLLKHLQINLGEAKGAQRYAEIISLIGVYFHFTEKHRQLHLLRNMQKNVSGSCLRIPDSPPLLNEIMYN